MRYARVCRWLLVCALVAGAGAWAQAAQYEVLGLGGAGGMYTPMVSPTEPGVMLVSCDMSGSYVSQDGGKSWNMIHHSQMNSSLGVRPLFVKNEIYWVKGGTTLKVSTDKGKTWTPVVQGAAPWGNARIATLAGIPDNPTVLFVGAGNNVYVTSDGGRTWKTVATGQGPCRSLTLAGENVYAALGTQVFVIRDGVGKPTAGQPANGGNLISVTAGTRAGKETVLTVVEGQGISRSTDGGNTWQQVFAKNDVREALMAGNQTAVAYANNRQDVFKTIDGGQTWNPSFRMTGANANVQRSWVQTELHWGYGISPLGLGVNPADPNVVLVSTQGDFYISRNGGGNWTQLQNIVLGVQAGDPGTRYKSSGLEVTSVWGFLFDPFDENRYYIAYTDIGFGRSVDKGQTWIWSARGCPWSNTFYKVVFDPYISGKMYAATSSRHDIPHWNHVSSNTPSHRGGVCVSTNNALDWTVLGKGLPELPCTSICIDPKSPKGNLTFYTTLFEGGVYKSTDNGQTWVKKSNGLGNPGNLHCLQVVVHPKTGDVYCSITAHRYDSDFRVPGGIWKSTDGGDSWADITKDLQLVWANGFVIHPDNPDIIYLTAATAPNKSQGGLYKTEDGGKSWTRVLDDAFFGKKRPPGYVHAMNVFLHPDNLDYVYLCSGHGLLMSPDAGKTWKWFDDLPFGSAQSVSFWPKDRKVMYVTTFGGGTWKGPYVPD